MMKGGGPSYYRGLLLTNSTYNQHYHSSIHKSHCKAEAFRILKIVRQRALYMDTDCIIYIAKEGYADPTKACSLGQLENEFKNDDKYITEFLAAGAKNYGYKTKVHQN